MSKPKTYWCCFDDKGKVMIDYSGTPIISSVKANAEDDLLYFSNNSGKIIYNGTVRKVNIVEVK